MIVLLATPDEPPNRLIWRLMRVLLRVADQRLAERINR